MSTRKAPSVGESFPHGLAGDSSIDEGTEDLTALPQDAADIRDRLPGEDETIQDLYSYVGKDGRTYQAYMPSEYMLPNDGDLTLSVCPKAEQQRLHLGHMIYRLIMDDKLAEAPIRSPEYALDVGTGTGIWALQFAEEHPTCQVIGTDISTIQPPSWMPNCRFVQENSELEDWRYPFPLDFVHLRGMLTCFNDITVVMRRAYDALAGGGWIELQDGHFAMRSPRGDDSLRGTPLARWCRLAQAGARARGRDVEKAARYRAQLVGAGFLDVHERVVHVPGGPWPAGDRARLVGAYTADVFHTGVVDSFRALVAASGELSDAGVDELTAQAKDNIRDPNIRWYMDWYIVYGRKPWKGEEPNAM